MKKNTFTIILLIYLIIFPITLTFGQCANTSDIYSFDYDGHTYEVVRENKTWTDAAACAVERGGYLTEINSQAEQDAIYNEIHNNAGIDNAQTVADEGGGASYLWIGGNDLATEGTWIWDGNNDGSGPQFWQGLSNGSAVGGLYNNWGHGTDNNQHEPDNYASGSIPHQNALAIALTEWQLGYGNLGQASQWNDLYEENTLYYIIEYDHLVTDPSVPNGSGTSADPYQIGNFDNLLWLQNHSGEWDKYYIQTADITADPNGSENWDRIGTNGFPFTGSYDGQNHTIDGLVIVEGSSTGQKGLFGVIDGATLENIGITNISLTNTEHIGSLVGESRGGTISNCYSTGNVVGDGQYVGGLVGVCEGTSATIISNSYSECSVTNNSGTNYSETGGFIGYLDENANHTITNCHATGDVSTPNNPPATSVGGFIGRMRATVAVSKCYSTGNVSGGKSDSWSPTGGFVGWNEKGTISECYSRGDVEGYQRVGGFAGYAKLSGALIENCYCFSNVTCLGGSDSQVGGFIGRNRENSEVHKCYCVGSVTYTGATDPTDKGFTGQTDGTDLVYSCFFDREVSNQNTDVEAVGETTENMKSDVIYLTAEEEWDFDNVWEIIEPSSGSANNNGLEKTSASGNYPRLQNQPDGALPVELTTFTASVNGTTVELNWVTATELNNYGFEVERRTENGDRRPETGDRGTETGNWSKVGFIEGAGNSNSVRHYSFSDNNNSAGKYFYRLKQIDIDGKYEYSNVIEVEIGIPEKFEVSQNYPNPFNPTTTISFSLPEKEKVDVKIYNITGEVVKVLLNEQLESGVHKVNFDANAGKYALTSGIYFYKVTAGENSIIRKMILMK